MEYVTGAVGRFGLATGRTLEIGSFDFNGSVRKLFSGEYIGIDHQPGQGVDQVMEASALAFPDASFDNVVSTSQLEHDPTFWLTLAEVGRVLRPGGHLVICTVSVHFPIHNEPDYYRFLPNTHAVLLNLASCDLIDGREDPLEGGPQITGKRR